MSRLEKQCLLASAAMHALLIALLVVASAFFPPRPATRIPLPRLTVVPTRLIDEALAGGGGNPRLQPSDAQVKGQTLLRPPAPPPPAPSRAVQPPAPRPVHPAQTERAEATPAKKVASARPDKPPVKDSARSDRLVLPDWLKPASSATIGRAQTGSRHQADAAAGAGAAAAARRAIEEARQAWGQVRQGFASGTVVEAWGPGGEAYASYDAFVQAVYDNAWRIPDGLTDEEATCKVRVTIARSGEVLSATIVAPSGNPVLDNSVRQALREVKFIAPFPEGAKEQQRTYTINFNLKSKQRIG